MHSPFRTLRRSTSSSASSINSASSVSYPYPRTHSTVMVLPSVGARPIAAAPFNGDSPTSSTPSSTGVFSPDTGYGRPRPPLNRAIPPIPESKSNESIISQASTMANRHSAPVAQDAAALESAEQPKPSTSSVAEKHDKSVVIANEMASNLGGKKAVQISTHETESRLPLALHKTKPKAEPPKSPLLSMAQSVRSRLTKIGSRFGRSPSRSPIRSSKSLVSMRRDISGDLGSSRIPSATSKLLKSSSMDEARRTVPQSSSRTEIVATITWRPSGSAIPKPVDRTRPSDVPRRQPVTTLIPSPVRRVPDEDFPPMDTSPSPVNSVASTEAAVTVSRRSQLSPIPSPSARSPVDTSKLVSPSIASSDVPPEHPPPPKPEPIFTAPPPPPSGGDLCRIPAVKEKPSKAPDGSTTPKATARILVRSRELSVERTDAVNGEEAKEKKSKLPKKSGIPKPTKSKSGSTLLASQSLKVATKMRDASPISRLRRFKRRSLELEGPTPTLTRKSQSVEEDSRLSATFPTDTSERSQLASSASAGKMDEMKLVKKRDTKSLIPGLAKRLDLRTVKSVSKNRRAPLAEIESSRVENSPAVELPPVNFESVRTGIAPPRGRTTGSSWRPWMSSAASRQEAFRTTRSTTVPTDNNSIAAAAPLSDANGNFVVESARPTMTLGRLTLAELLASPPNARRTTTGTAGTGGDTHRSGLIDDEITDQPMLISTHDFGATLSRDVNENIEPVMREQLASLQVSGISEELHMRNSSNVNDSGRSKRKTHESSSYTYEPTTSDNKLEPRLPESKLASASHGAREDDEVLSQTITDVKAQLNLIRDVVEQDNENMQKLQDENETLRQQLSEKDEIIKALQAQLKQQSVAT